MIIRPIKRVIRISMPDGVLSLPFYYGESIEPEQHSV